MTSLMFLALSPADLHPVGTLNLSAPLICALVSALVLVVIFIIAAIIGSQTKIVKDEAPRGTHNATHDKSVWRERINQVVAAHKSGKLTREQAFAQLAQITRDFAGEASGKDFSSRTLADLNKLPRNASNQQTLDMLRQTVAALYPPEFADATINRSARETTVDDAAGWVSTLVERWR